VLRSTDPEGAATASRSARPAHDSGRLLAVHELGVVAHDLAHGT
jgi:hypothetical protein